MLCVVVGIINVIAEVIIIIIIIKVDCENGTAKRGALMVFLFQPFETAFEHAPLLHS